ncbi:hypothetical protein BN2497_12687 [Janthinobacterium sp. CG23_2]|nr:hypothetical protein BN2497_12687 [Janthinobacterium sp. CG23_2]CUU32741.1 hypothetical protein BN3177_12687 [Janthinobacterium sp. CG23_2]
MARPDMPLPAQNDRRHRPRRAPVTGVRFLYSTQQWWQAHSYTSSSITPIHARQGQD